MRLKKYLIPMLACVLACMLLLAGCGEGDSKKEPESKPESKTVTVTDSLGRSVELPQPLEKVVVLNRNVAEAMRVLKIQDKVIGVSDSVQGHPYLGLQDKDLVGKYSEPSLEKIVELNPQVVITYGSLTAGAELAEKLEPAGIKVVLLDLFEQETYDNDLEILGKMFGKEKEASAFLKWKAEKIAILDRVKDLKPEQRVSVFTMTSSNFEKKKWSTRAKGTAPHQAIEMAGGINVARELSDNPEVSPEWILQQNPAALVFAEYSEDVIGFEVGNLENAEKFKEKVKNDKVFSKTDAVKKDQIYIMASDIFGGNKSYLGAPYLAKWFYPDQFKDIDPDEFLKEYFEKWLEVPFQGKWVYPPSSR
ncbi:MAG TPA: ABC transporter substrate-binding protein [Bacillota bacterium]|nr:ABC transporter substrate-binding protein [Bacillota bacterium]HPZ42145.1 ABC transporter substrate-binding protein [Bacillota bacterium]HQD53015.1 ABC transporter substrate-binding protein [Bacillota bacterium]